MSEKNDLKLIPNIYGLNEVRITARKKKKNQPGNYYRQGAQKY